MHTPGKHTQRPTQILYTSVSCAHFMYYTNTLKHLHTWTHTRTNTVHTPNCTHSYPKHTSCQNNVRTQISNMYPPNSHSHMYTLTPTHYTHLRPDRLSGNLLTVSLTISPPCLMMVMASAWPIPSVLFPLISSNSSPTCKATPTKGRGHKDTCTGGWGAYPQSSIPLSCPPGAILSTQRGASEPAAAGSI